MVVAFISKRVNARFDKNIIISREKEANELLTSFVADIDLITDWVFFYEVVQKNGTEDEVHIGIRVFQILSCIAGSIAWSIIATNGWVLILLWTILRQIAYFLVRPIAFILYYVILYLIMMPMSAVFFLLFKLFEFMKVPIFANWMKEASDELKKERQDFSETFEDRFYTLIEPITDAVDEGIHISAGWVLLLGVIFEDIPQVVITFLIEDVDDTGEIGTTAMMNLVLAGFDILFKCADAWDSRKTEYKTTNESSRSFSQRLYSERMRTSSRSNYGSLEQIEEN